MPFKMIKTRGIGIASEPSHSEGQPEIANVLSPGACNRLLPNRPRGQYSAALRERVAQKETRRV